MVLFFIEVALRVWGMSLIRYAEGEGEQISMKVVASAPHPAGRLADLDPHRYRDPAQPRPGRKSRPNTRALTMLPLIRNVLFATIAVIAPDRRPGQHGHERHPLLAGAGVIGLAIGFGAQSLVADLITGLFIIIEDSLSIDDYVDVGGHLGTVEGLTIRTVRLRDLDGVVHTIPFSEKEHQELLAPVRLRDPLAGAGEHADRRRGGAGARGRDGAAQRPGGLPQPVVADGIAGRGEFRQRPGDPARFKTAPIKQWEVQRAFNLRLRRRLDQAGLELSMPRLNVQLSRAPRRNPRNRTSRERRRTAASSATG